MKKIKIPKVWSIFLAFVVVFTSTMQISNALEDANNFDIDSTVTYGKESNDAIISLNLESVGEGYTVEEIKDPKGNTMDLTDLDYIVKENGTYEFTINYRQQVTTVNENGEGAAQVDENGEAIIPKLETYTKEVVVDGFKVVEEETPTIAKGITESTEEPIDNTIKEEVISSAAENEKINSQSLGEIFHKDGFKYTILNENGVTGTVEINGYVNPPTSSLLKVNLIIPNEVFYKNTTYIVTIIGDEAFYYNRGLEEVIIPDSVTSIGRSAFIGCGISNDIIIPDGVTSIGEWAFQNNYLENLTIPNSVTSIGQWAFSFTNLKTVVLSNNLKIISAGMFSSSHDLTNIIIPDGVTSIGEYAFTDCNLENLTIPNSVTSIGQWAFRGNQLTEVIIPNSVTSIENGAFASNSLTHITISENLTTLEKGVFQGNDLTSITIPENIKNIEPQAFDDNYMSTIYLYNQEMINIFSLENMNNITTKKGEYREPSIVEIYASEVIVEYKESRAIIKTVGETFQIEVIVGTIYKQIDRFDDAIDKFIGADNNAETKPYNNGENMTMNYQWYKDGVEIIGATDAIYSETAQIPGIYQYHVTVNGVVLDEIQVMITTKDIETGENENKDDFDSKDKNVTKKKPPKSEGETQIPTGDNSNVPLLLLAFIGGGLMFIRTIKKKMKDTQ